MASQLRSSVRYIVVAVSALLALFVVSQVAQVIGLANSVHPWFGAVVGLLLVGGLVWLLAVPTVAYFRLSPALQPPKETSGAQHDKFIATYLAACRENPRLEGQPLESEADLNAALKLLTKETESVASRTASRVFIGTAISQYGALDALIVAFLQARMVWEIAHVYQSRPSLRHMGYLYTNVLTTSLVASNLDKVDLSQYVQPVLAGMVGQSAAAVPGVTGVATQFSNAVFQGSVNAFLTLRLGMVAIAYSNATSTANRSVVWQSAVVRAGSLLVRTVTSGTAELSKAFAVATAKVIATTAMDAGHKVADGAVWFGTGAAAVGQAIGTATATAASAVGAATVTTASAVNAAGTGAVERAATTTRSATKRFRRQPAKRNKET